MKKLYEKSQLDFFLLWLLIYIGIQNLGHALEASLGSAWYVSSPANVLLALWLYRWVKKNGLLPYYGLGKIQVPARNLLWFLPLIVVSTDNLWRGVHWNLPAGELIFFLGGMAAVAFLEELLIRGFLFQYLRKDSLTQSVAISTLAFSAGHILNLFSGRLSLAESLWQMAFALVLGLLYAVVLLKSGSLWPCICSHAAINMLSAFAYRGDIPFGQRLPLNLLSMGISLLYIFHLLKSDS